jgi:hypothetical protein
VKLLNHGAATSEKIKKEKMSLIKWFHLLLVVVWFTQPSFAYTSGTSLVNPPADSIPCFNYIIGTQQIGNTYSFGDDTKVVNAAKEILKMGSSVLKMALTSNYADQNGIRNNHNIKTIAELVELEPSIQKVLAMPFTDYLFWAYPFTSHHSGLWGTEENAYSKEDQEAEYKEMYELTAYLLNHFKGTGKTFYLGNWEGDWHLYSDRNLLHPPSVVRSKAMADWLNVRQKAVDDAKKLIGTDGVQVYFYVEVNQGILALTGKTCVTNDVLPLLNKPPDFISISSYSIQSKTKDSIHLVLDYLNSKMKPRDDISGSRVIIGEYGFARTERMTAIQQAEKYRQTAVKYLSWGPRFILSWQLYDNSYLKFEKPKEYNLIDKNNTYTPLYKMHQEFLAKARIYVEEYCRRNQRPPSSSEYISKAVDIMKKIKLDAPVTK